MILECDVGNTACKWRVIDDGFTVVDYGLISSADCDFSELNTNHQITRVRAASVSTPEVVDALGIWIKKRYGLSIEWAVSQRTCFGVTNAYDDVSKLGVDRWLVAVAAYQITSGPVLIVDVGSALTVDAVDPYGKHLGGYIVPGISLMEGALLKGTGGVRFTADEEARGIEFGTSTATGVRSGVRAALVGASKLAIEQMRKRFPKGLTIFLTGGSAEYVCADLREQVVYEPNLVLDGLRWVLP